jgi:hypothetical protein
LKPETIKRLEAIAEDLDGGEAANRVSMDATVQPKAITFPTDAKLLHAAIRGLGRGART